VIKYFWTAADRWPRQSRSVGCMPVNFPTLPGHVVLFWCWRHQLLYKFAFMKTFYHMNSKEPEIAVGSIVLLHSNVLKTWESSKFHKRWVGSYLVTSNGKNVGFLCSATYTANHWNQNSALYNLGSGSWLARASGAAALCGLSTARANGHWTSGCSQHAHHRSNQPHQAFTP